MAPEELLHPLDDTFSVNPACMKTVRLCWKHTRGNTQTEQMSSDTVTLGLPHPGESARYASNTAVKVPQDPGTKRGGLPRHPLKASRYPYDNT